MVGREGEGRGRTCVNREIDTVYRKHRETDR